MAVSLTLQPMTQAFAAGTTTVAAQADQSPTLTIVAGAATPVSPGSNTYRFPHLTVTNSDPKRPIKSITVQFTSSITTGDAIVLTADTANGFETLATNKRGNQSANNNNGADAAAWSTYLRDHLQITLDGTTTKSLRMIASFDPVGGMYDYNSTNGHYYETVDAAGASWQTAFKAASEKTYMGMQGYLVTITSQQEHDYVYTMIGKNCWMGSTCLDAYTGPVKDTYKEFYAQHGITIPASTMPGGAYYFWVCGPEKGKLVSYGLGTPHAAPDPSPDPANNNSATIYNNWSGGEPNKIGRAHV